MNRCNDHTIGYILTPRTPKERGNWQNREQPISPTKILGISRPRHQISGTNSAMQCQVTVPAGNCCAIVTKYTLSVTLFLCQERLATPELPDLELNNLSFSTSVPYRPCYRVSVTKSFTQIGTNFKATSTSLRVRPLTDPKTCRPFEPFPIIFP